MKLNMSNKKNNKKKNNIKNKKLHDKKVLDDVDVVKKNKKENNKIEKKKDNISINDKIQSVVSILFTIVIFLLILVLIMVLYNKFLKKDNNDLDNICSKYIKKDYNIKNEDVLEYIIDNRYIIYNIEEFDSNNIDTNIINNFSKYIIWNSESEYTICNDHEYCLDTKKEIDYNSLKEKLEYYFNLDSLNLVFDYDFKENDTTRLFINDDKVILTFKEMEYETFKHDIVDIRIDENKIYIIFALSRRLNENNFSYIGYKNLELEYNDNNFIILKIKTTKN